MKPWRQQVRLPGQPKLVESLLECVLEPLPVYAREPC